MKERRDAARARFEALGIDALFVTKPVNVRYLTGFSGSNGQLLLGADEDVFLTDPRYDEQSAHEVPDIRREIYYTDARAIGEAAGVFGALAAAVAAAGITRLGVEANVMTLATARALHDAVRGVELVETFDEVERLRAVKDAGEVDAIRTACSYADAALTALLPQLREGMSEIDVATVLEFEMRRAGSQGLSFDTIAAFGEQAAEPHHKPTTRRLRRGDLIKLDFGATHAGYHSDMTRTIAFGEPGDDLVAMYEAVRAAQQAGLDAVRAGVESGAVDEAARAALRARGHEFGHGTGHGVGLEVHEAPPVRAGARQVLAPGMVITVEPGVYIGGVGGVRIEDSVVVTADGCDILTASTKDLVKV